MGGRVRHRVRVVQVDGHQGAVPVRLVAGEDGAGQPRTGEQLGAGRAGLAGDIGGATAQVAAGVEQGVGLGVDADAAPGPGVVGTELLDLLVGEEATGAGALEAAGVSAGGAGVAGPDDAVSLVDEDGPDLAAAAVTALGHGPRDVHEVVVPVGAGGLSRARGRAHVLIVSR